MTSEHLSGKRSRLLPKWLIIGFILISFIGFLDTGYLTIKHYTGGLIGCNLFEGCEQVTNSKYSVIFGIPLALLGLLYYLFMLISSLLYFDTKNPVIPKIFLPVTTLGFIFSGYLVYLQIWVIKALCQYCILSAITSTALFILSLIAFKYLKSKPQ